MKNLGLLLLCGLAFLTIGSQAKSEECDSDDYRQAIKRGDTKKFKELVTDKKTADCFFKTKKYAETPLVVLAIQKNEREIVDYMVNELEADVDAKQIKAKNSDGQTALFKIIKKCLNEETVGDNMRDNIFDSKLETCEEQVEFLVGMGADVNAKNEQGETPLEWVTEGAAYYGEDVEKDGEDDETDDDDEAAWYKKMNKEALRAYKAILEILRGV